MRRDARLLKRKAVISLRRSMSAFNSLEDADRHTTVLLHLQHAFEMLLKASLHQRKVPVLDPHSGQSISFKKCLNQGIEHLGLTERDLGTLRTIEQLRNDEYHYLGLVNEGILFIHLRAGVTIFDQLLRAVFGETLADQMPARVLPISTEPPQSLDVLIDEEFSQVRQLLAPGRRRGAQARARLRTLLALEGHVAEGELVVTERDVSRVEAAIRRGEERRAVFPRLTGLTSTATGMQVAIKVKTTKREGMPVHFVADDDADAVAVREVDLTKKFHFTKTELARHAGLTTSKALALRDHLGIDADPNMHWSTTRGHTVIEGYSDAALHAMRDSIQGGVDVNKLWRDYAKRKKS
jgi:hypothetical protein